jgi:hypothetical protein
MNDYATHAGGMASLQSRLGADCPTVTWNNQVYQIIPGSTMRRADLAPGGFQMNADLRFEALVSTFANGGTITDATSLKNTLLSTPVAYQGDVYKVDAVGIRPGGLQVIVECKSIVQNA